MPKFPDPTRRPLAPPPAGSAPPLGAPKPPSPPGPQTNLVQRNHQPSGSKPLAQAPPPPPPPPPTGGSPPLSGPGIQANLASPPPPPPTGGPSPQPPPPPQASPSPTPTIAPPPPPGGQPPVPPQENPTIKPSSASPGDVKKSPFRIIIPALIGLTLIGLVGFFAFRFISGRSSSSSDPATTTTTQTQTTPGQQIALNYWGLWESSSILQQVFDEFETQNPGVTISYTQQSHQDYRERLQSALARGDGPDIFRFHNTWVPMLRSDLDSLPEAVMSSSEFQSTFYPVASTDLRSTTSFYGIPLMIDGLGLYYNKAIFASSGKSPPTSWDELRQTASELTITTGGTIERAGIALGTASNVDHFSDILGLMLLQNGADPANPTTALASDAMTFYTIFAKTDNIWDDTLPPSTFAFATEKTAMIIAPSWRAHEIADINPDLEFAIVPVPQLPTSQVNWASYWVEGVSAKGSNKQMAWQLLKYLSSKETLRTLYTAASNERLFGEPFSRVDMADQLLSDPLVGAYISQAPQAQSWYLASRTFDNGINDRIIKYYEDAVNATNQGGSGDPLETVSQGVLQVLSQYSLSSQ